MIDQLLIPVQKHTLSAGRFTWPAQVILASPSACDLLPLEQLASDLRGSRKRVRIVRNAFGPATLRIRRDTAGELPAEGYRLVISAQGVEISAADDPGAFYAIQTLRELVAAAPSLRAVRIEDWPVFGRRGVYMDCSRGKVPTLQRVKDVIDLLSSWKVNELQLYIENVFQFARHPDIGKGYSPFSAADLLEIQDYCRARHVNFVGSLSSFGHMETILALPQYRHLGELQGNPNKPGGTTLCPQDPGSIKLLGELYEEFLPLFEARDFNSCGDEPFELGKGRSKERCERLGTGQVYMEFLLKIHGLVASHGKRTNVWADIVLDHAELLGSWPKDIVMLNWEYGRKGGRIPRTREIAAAGLELMVCPGTNGWLSHGCRLAMGMDNIATFAAEGLKHKAIGLLNTDWGDYGHRNMLAVSLHNYAWGAAHGWHAKVRREGFGERFVRSAFPQAPARKLADAIVRLGSLEESLGLADMNSASFYNLLRWPLTKAIEDIKTTGEFIDALSAKRARAHLEALEALDWPRLDDRFGREMMAEFGLGVDQDVLAIQRMLLAQRLRAGQAVPAADVRRAAGASSRLARTMPKVWLMGNRPSRLGEFLKALRSEDAVYRRLAKR